MTNIQYPISNIKSRLSNIQYPISNIVLILLMFVGFLYRVYGLSENYSFWTDEEHVAIFTRAILQQGKPVLANGYSTRFYQWLQYWLSAISAKIFGLNEFGIRFPSVIFGVLSIWAVYLLGRELFANSTSDGGQVERSGTFDSSEVFISLVAALFTTFLKIEILWSRQARPYQALQFFYLLSAYFVYQLAKKKKFHWRHFVGFLGCGVLASLMHGMGLIVFFVGLLYLLIFRFSWHKKKWAALGLVIPLIFSYIFRGSILSRISQIGKINNLFYYRVFLWHNYSLLVLLALVGFLSQSFKKKNNWQILVLFLVVQGIIASFFLGQPFVRYFYIVFPFLILLSSVGLGAISRYLSSLIKPHQYPISSIQYPISSIQYLILFILVLFIIAMGNKFTLLPQRVYSLNEDMQEVPEVDYKKIYSFIKEKLDENPEAVYISNWNDHPIWYLGEGGLDYLLRKRTIPPSGKDPFSGAVYIKSLEELESLIKGESKGLILLESWESELPQGTADYIKKNLNKELEVDRIYPVQPRYWPVEVYSWGMD